MPWWDQYGYDKKRAGTHYAEMVFLHLVGCASHIMHSGASGHEMSTHYFSCLGGTGTGMTNSSLENVTPKLCFCIWWDLWVT
jgi:hypothetical protein